MQLRPLGKTGLQISEIVFGAGAVGGAVFRGEREDRLETVRRALDAGVNWIDTAPSYGAGQSEENLGWILPELGRSPHLSTKVRLAADELADTSSAVRASIEQSLQRLGVARVDLVQLHNPIGIERDERTGRLSLEDVLGAQGVGDALDRVRAEGLAGHIGFTALGSVDALHEVARSGRFETAQVYHNILNPSATRAMPAGFSAANYREFALVCQEHGLGVLNIRVLAAGMLGGQEPRGGAMSPGSEPERDARRARLVEEALADEPGSMAQKAIRFALGQPGISGVLIGFSSPAQVDEAIAATQLPALSSSITARLDALWESDLRGI